MNLKDALSKGLTSTTKVWKSEMRKADRNDRMPSYGRFYSNRRTVKDAVYKHLEEAYNKASSNGKFWANARQIFYALRPLIQGEIDKDVNKLKQAYITGVLLKDYLEEGCGNSNQWRIAWDARGHFEEPHTRKQIGLGGVDVEDYQNKWNSDVSMEMDFDVKTILPTIGPEDRYKSVLFIEKEGFNEILDEAKIAETYDMAIMSTKGMPVKAACDLLHALPADVKIFALHDFDKSGFTIIKTLREGVRLSEGSEVIDLGFRLEDVKGIPTEDVGGDTSVWAARNHLEECGATPEEIEFLIPESSVSHRGWDGQRVELNAITSEEFVEFLRRKLDQHKPEKVIPAEKVLKETYRRAMLGVKVRDFIDKRQEDAREYKAPKSLAAKIRGKLDASPNLSWDQAIWELAREQEILNGEDDDK